MPPKKKKGGKKDKDKDKDKKGKKSAKKLPPPLMKQPEILLEGTKEFYLVQIRDLENRLARYQRKCDELEVSMGQFNDKFLQMETDKREVVAFYKKQVEAKTDEVVDLNDRYIGLQQTRDIERDQYESQIQQQRTEFQEMKDQLTSENLILANKLGSLEEFKVQKEELMAKMVLMEEELRQKDIQHKENLYNLEKKAVIDKDRLKKEMILRVNQVAAEFRKVSNKQMAETTKRTIRENVSINAQLAKMSDKTMELINENDELRVKEKKQRLQIDLLEATEKELAKKNHSSQKIIRMLTEKCRNQEEIIADYELKDQEFVDLDTEADVLRQQVQSTRAEIQSLARENETLDEELNTTKQERDSEQIHKRRVELTMARAAEALRLALRKTVPDAEKDDELEDEEEKEGEEGEEGKQAERDARVNRREEMLEQLLILLNSAAAVGLGPHPGDLGKQYQDSAGTGVRANIGAHLKGIQKGELPMSTMSKGGTLPHYSLGDLGLIPRPKQNIPTFLERTHTLSTTTRLGGLRKVLTRSVAIQTHGQLKGSHSPDQALRASSPPPSPRFTINRSSNNLGPVITRPLRPKVSA